MWTSFRALYGVFCVLPLNQSTFFFFFLSVLIGIHTNLQIVIIPHRSLSYNLLPHGMCPTREQMGLCTVAHTKYKKSEGDADYSAHSTIELKSSCLSLSVHKPPTHSACQNEHSQLLQVGTRKLLHDSVMHTREYLFQTVWFLNIQIGPCFTQ